MSPHSALPDSLAYLQHFVNRLSKLPVDSLHEDLDAKPLITAIRKHFGQCTPEAAARFRSDVKALGEWVDTSGGCEHPAHWILGFLANCELDDLFQDILAVEMPGVEMDCPPRWKAERSPASLCIRKRGVLAVFTAIVGEGGWELLCQQWEAARQGPPPDPNAALRQVYELQARITPGWRPPSTPLPHIEATETYSDVHCGDVVGYRCIRCQTSPMIWKTVTYLLTVPGGHVRGQVSRLKPGTFDEAPVEAVLTTLRVILTS